MRAGAVCNMHRITFAVRIWAIAALFFAMAGGQYASAASATLPIGRNISARAQIGVPGVTGPTGALADAFVTACRQDPDGFATHLTSDNAAAFRELPQSQRIAILKRIVLLEQPGK